MMSKYDEDSNVLRSEPSFPLSDLSSEQCPCSEGTLASPDVTQVRLSSQELYYGIADACSLPDLMTYAEAVFAEGVV
jgi:hypothetical protein